MINTLYGKNLTEDDIPFDDEKTWDLMSRGDTLGVFQMASNVAIPVLKRVKPKNLEELSAINAFIRPGASGLDEYLEGKNDNTKIRKLDPRIDRHLKSTYGAIVYQEQIMFLISELMGISFGQADLYRRALEKPNKGKNVQVVADFNNNVVKKAQERGIDPKVADLVRQLIIDNSGYGFNKSHSIAYSIITYWTAWIKANYPLVFYCQMFNGNLDQLSAFMAEATKNGVVIKPPHVSYSKYDSIIEDEENKIIRIGMNAIKGVGPAAVDSIVKAQPYTDIDDFFERNQLRSVNKRVIESLISVDAFRDLGIKIEANDIPDVFKDRFNIQNSSNGLIVKLQRNQIKYWYEKVIEASSVKTINKYSVPRELIKGKYFEIYELAFEKDNTIVIPEDKLTLFELSLEQVEQYKNNRRTPKAFLKLTDNDEIKATPFRKPFIMFSQQISEIVENKLLTYLNEVENLGYSFLPHPLEQFMHKINSFDEAEDGDEITTAGIVKEIIERQTKTRKKYYWMIIQTPRENVRITLWDDQFKRYHSMVKLHNVIVVRGVKGYGGLSCNAMKQL